MFPLLSAAIDVRFPSKSKIKCYEAAMIRASLNNTVKVNYTGKLADGTIFDASPEDSPLTFIVGRGEVIKGFDAAVVDMAQGEIKTVVIAPDQAYGEAEPDRIETILRADLPENLELIEGGQLEVTQEDGRIILLMIDNVTEETVTLNSNHPLAGKELTFEIEMLEIDTDPPKEFPPHLAAAFGVAGKPH